MSCNSKSVFVFLSRNDLTKIASFIEALIKLVTLQATKVWGELTPEWQEAVRLIRAYAVDVINMADMDGSEETKRTCSQQARAAATAASRSGRVRRRHRLRTSESRRQAQRAYLSLCRMTTAAPSCAPDVLECFELAQPRPLDQTPSSSTTARTNMTTPSIVMLPGSPLASSSILEVGTPSGDTTKMPNVIGSFSEAFPSFNTSLTAPTPPKTTFATLETSPVTPAAMTISSSSPSLPLITPEMMQGLVIPSPPVTPQSNKSSSPFQCAQHTPANSSLSPMLSPQMMAWLIAPYSPNTSPSAPIPQVALSPDTVRILAGLFDGSPRTSAVENGAAAANVANAADLAAAAEGIYQELCG